jgi:hypothetical protein
MISRAFCHAALAQWQSAALWPQMVFDACSPLDLAVPIIVAGAADQCSAQNCLTVCTAGRASMRW